MSAYLSRGRRVGDGMEWVGKQMGQTYVPRLSPEPAPRTEGVSVGFVESASTETHPWSLVGFSSQAK